MEVDEKKDIYGRDVKDIYKELEKDFTIPKELGNNEEEADINQSLIYFWGDDANELLAGIGLDQNFEIDNYPRSTLERLFRYYHDKSQQKLEDGKVIDINPLPYYRAESNDYELELGKFGYELGKIGTIGIYYRLLPEDSFRHNYYLGKFERAVELDNDNLIFDVVKEIQIFDASKKEEELEYLCNTCFKEKEEGKTL